MEVFIPRVKDISLYKEMAQNTVNPLELIREGISNSHDAEAKIISIIISRDAYGKFVIEIHDDGKGLNMNDIHRFFNLGDSKKSQLGIGEKGLGTKTYFKSERIVVNTQTKNNEAYKVVMEKPWEYLSQNILPEYLVDRIDPVPGKCGTVISIEGYVINNPEKYFNFETIKDYILWFTAAGSFKTYFANHTELHKYIQNMQVAPRVFIEDRILNIKEEIAGTHQFHPPYEKPKEDDSEEVYKRSVNYCRHFGPYHRATNIEGEYVSFQIYGTVSGVNCRKNIVKLRQGESLKSRFGVYLAKDFIPFAKKTEFIADPSFFHYHLLVNSQCFKLSADRNNITNLEDPKVKWVYEEAKQIINEDIIPLAEDGYFKLRRIEEQEYSIRLKKSETQARLEEFDKVDNLLLDDFPILKKPKSESQVAVLFASLISHEKTKNLIKYLNNIGYYSTHSTTDMICYDHNNKKVLVEIEYQLSRLFKHDHPYNTFDYIVCWSVDMDVNERKSLSDGNVLSLMKEDGNWILKYGTEKVIPVLELRGILGRFRNIS